MEDHHLCIYIYVLCGYIYIYIYICITYRYYIWPIYMADLNHWATCFTLSFPRLQEQLRSARLRQGGLETPRNHL